MVCFLFESGLRRYVMILILCFSVRVNFWCEPCNKETQSNMALLAQVQFLVSLITFVVTQPLSGITVSPFRTSEHSAYFVAQDLSLSTCSFPDSFPIGHTATFCYKYLIIHLPFLKENV